MKRICGIPRTEFPIQHTAPLMTLVWGRDCLQAGVLLVMTVAVCAGAVGLNAPHVVGLGPAGTHAEAASDVSDSPSTRRVVPLPESLRAAKLLQNVAIADFNGDGIADLAIADFVSDSVLILIGDADDWTPAGRCVDFVAKYGAGARHRPQLKLYPGATHAFDGRRPDRVYFGHHLAYDPEASADAAASTRRFFDERLRR